MRTADLGRRPGQRGPPQGAILPSLKFADLFEQKLPELVAPDRG